MRNRACVLILGWIAAGTPIFGQENADIPEPVSQLLEQAAGSWYVKIGRVDGACTVNSRAGGHCVLVEGRKFADAISFTSLLGWYAPKQQIIGLLVFENGESLLLRATVDGGDDQLSAEGDVVGVLSGRAIRVTYTATCRAGAWAVEVQTANGEKVTGNLHATGRNR